MPGRKPSTDINNQKIDRHVSAYRDRVQAALQLAEEIAGKYQLDSIRPLLRSCLNFSATEEITIAVLGRFKAGKSSFLNHLLGRDVLPVGVVPVTAIITEIAYGPLEIAEVHYSDGRVERVSPTEIRTYISEAENPENVKRIDRLAVDLPELERFRGLRFVDTPGLESALAHNTETSMEWLPNAALALVAISVDPPLSQRDLDLIQALYASTPSVSVLLTKTDLLSDRERGEVIAYIEAQLKRRLDRAPRVFPYSIRPGYESFRAELESALIDETLRNRATKRNTILAHKTATLVIECEAYLELAYRSAQVRESDRAALRAFVSVERKAVIDEKSELRLTVQHAAAGARTEVLRHLEERQHEIEKRLVADLRFEFPKWSVSLRAALDGFEMWGASCLTAELSVLSSKHRRELAEPVLTVRRRIQRALQAFRDRLSFQTEKVFGIPLRTSEVEITAEEPRHPDVRVGRVFDRNWELLSPVAPMPLLRRIILRHFERKIPFIVYANISRLATQWDEAIAAAMFRMQKEAESRLDDLISTVERLIASTSMDVLEMRADLDRIRQVRKPLEMR